MSKSALISVAIASAFLMTVLSAFISSKVIMVGDSPVYSGFPFPHAVKKVGIACSTPLHHEINYLKLNLGLEEACNEGLNLRYFAGNLLIWFSMTASLAFAFKKISLFSKNGKRR